MATKEEESKWNDFTNNVKSGIPPEVAMWMTLGQPNDQPQIPGYVPAYDPSAMSIYGDLQKRLGGINLNTDALKAYSQYAMGKGPSAWAQLSTQRQGLEDVAARERAKQEAASSTAQAQSGLAMRGGLSQGAKERLAMSGQQAAMAGSQDATRQGALNRLGIGIEDQRSKMAALGQVPGMENQAFQANLAKQGLLTSGQQYDIGNQINETNRLNEYNMGKYGEQMKGWAAGKQADATAASGKK